MKPDDIDPSLKPIFRDLGSALRADPLLSELTAGKVDFRIWTPAQMDRKVSRGDSPIFLLPKDPR